MLANVIKLINSIDCLGPVSVVSNQTLGRSEQDLVQTDESC